jgi:hypothetical protein
MPAGAEWDRWSHATRVHQNRLQTLYGAVYKIWDHLVSGWKDWRSPAGEWISSFAVITTTPNELCAKLHNRMPVVLKPDAWPVWLGEEPADLPQLKSLLAPYVSDDMVD